MESSVVENVPIEIPSNCGNTDGIANLKKLDDTSINNVRLASCGSFEGCMITEDCTSCENCIVNYIETYIKHTESPMLLSCSKRICRADNLTDFKVETGVSFDQTDEFKNRCKSNLNLNLQHINASISEMNLSVIVKMELDETAVEENDVKLQWDETGEKNDVKIEQNDFFLESPEISEGGQCGYNDDQNSQIQLKMCGKCLGCTAANCGTCWPCIERNVLASKDLSFSIICRAKKCHMVKGRLEKTVLEKIEEGANKRGETKPRKRCGSCAGCMLKQNCGICGACVKKQSAKLIGRIYKSTCTLRKCHGLKSEKSQRCEDCDGCTYCNIPNPNFCRVKRCQKPKFIKIKSKTPKADKIIGLKKTEVNERFEISKETNEDLASKVDEEIMKIESLSSGQAPTQTKVEEWLNNILLEEETPNESSTLKNIGTFQKKGTQNKLKAKNDLKRGSSKNIKRTKNCGKCDGCRAEACGYCQSCKINQQYDEQLILGKVPCLSGICKFPVELRGLDIGVLSLMAEQDDTSNGSVCPVKVVQGNLYDFRCYFCKKLPRVGSATRSELMRHYASFHFADKLREEFANFMIGGYCSLCDVQCHSISSHFGQKHNEVVKYLPLEAAALCPKNVQGTGRNELRRHCRAPAISNKKNSSRALDWPQLPEGFDPSSQDRNWKGNSINEVDEKLVKKYEIVDGFVIDHDTNVLDEPLPFGDKNDPDYRGVRGLCSVCKKEFIEVTKATIHLHDDHNIIGGSSYIMRDCEHFIKSGFIKLLPHQNETSIEDSVTKHTKDICLEFSVDTDSASLGKYLSKKRGNTARKSVVHKSRSFLKMMAQQKNDGETSRQNSGEENEAKSHTSDSSMSKSCSSHDVGATAFWEAIGLVPEVEKNEMECLAD